MHRSGLDVNLLEPVKIRVSVNQSLRLCLDMIPKTPARGETEQRLIASAWQEAPFILNANGQISLAEA